MSRTLATNLPGGGIAVEEMGVVLEHRTAAGGVDDDRVEIVGVEGVEIARARSSAGASAPE